MATTKIWDVRAHVSKLLAYVANKNKTTMEFENKNFDESERLAAEILGLPYDHFATEEKKFVSGINCTPDNAKEIMLSLLEDTDSSDIQAYHGYQSFKPNEVTPDAAHAIGVQLANELWGCCLGRKRFTAAKGCPIDSSSSTSTTFHVTE